MFVKLFMRSHSFLKIIGEKITLDELILLWQWRDLNWIIFGDDERATLKSTEKWFKNYYLDKKRILFWVIGDKGEKIGHMGLSTFTEDELEIDNVIRGVEKYKGIMSQAIQELLTIARRLAKDIFLKVKSDNEKAIKFYETNGFRPLGKILYKNQPFLQMKYEDIKL